MHFTIPSKENLPIRGDFEAHGNPRGLVVLVHGFKGFKDWGFFPWLAQRLVQHRLAVCRFNMSRSGIGENPESFDRLDLFEGDTYSIELADLRSAVALAQREFPSLPTFLLGHSRGGGVALLGAEVVANLHGVVAWSPIARVDRWDDATKKHWREQGFLEVMNARTKQVMRTSVACLDDVEKNRVRLDILAAAERLRVPLFVVHGQRDNSVSWNEGRDVVSRAADASLLLLGRAGHTFNAIHPLIDIPFELLLAAEVSAHFISAHL
jgi:pimeloyl-ACP methyl ester carboxylesterase